MATVNGPASSTNKAIARWNGTAGDTIQDSSVTITDGGDVSATSFKRGTLTMINSSNYYFYGNGNKMADNVGNLYYTDGSRYLVDSAGTLYYAMRGGSQDRPLWQSTSDSSTFAASTAFVQNVVGARADGHLLERITSGVGATLTNSGTQAAISIDGVSLAANDRLLVKNQATAAQNGIYKVTTVGSGSTNWVLTRTTDFNTAADTGVVEGAFTIIEEGTSNAGTFWIETGAGPFTIGTTAITFTQLQVTNAPTTAHPTYQYLTNSCSSGFL